MLDKIDNSALRNISKEIETTKDVKESVKYHIQEIKMESDLFIKCPECGEVLIKAEMDDELQVCFNCNHHMRINSRKRIEFIFDQDSIEYLNENMKSSNPLDYPKYSEKTGELINKLKINEAVITGIGSINGNKTCFGVMDSKFIMGSMGSVVGEKLARMLEKATALKLPAIIFTVSGGARMQEGILSLMQMAKVSAAVKRHSNAGLLYITVITDPTTGGVTASFASLGDIIIAEPKATIGFAGKRVIEQTIKQKLPSDFQSSEFMLEHGFVDMIVHRRDMKATLSHLIEIHGRLSEVNIEKSLVLIEEGSNEEPSLCDKNLDPWEIVKIARNKNRPNYKDYIEELIDGFVELHGDRYYKDDEAIVGGIGYFNGIPVTIISHAKGKTIEENLKRSFGSPYPEGYRKALRLMKEAEKFNRPIICLIDTQGAYCGIGAEERGQGEAIAKNLLELSDLKTPIISVVIGEGGSGGALALGVADKVFMLENSIYSVISPEGCASILMKDSSKADEASRILKLTAKDLKALKVIDGIIDEPLGGAHNDVNCTVNNVKATIYKNLLELLNKDMDKLVDERYSKLREIGEYIE
ncbi:acetyl-CoA carboxylase carboxyltransferase subunit alpha [Candidatus Clostridium stratigraminis]|uniref:Multifunctional fusion protein n=1 Tax=Candidatus Clostridium stratigraminis TaxID=3381661 RepID=A0ABW8T1Q0_9CLOT